MLPAPILASLKKWLHNHSGNHSETLSEVLNFIPLSGGSINYAYKIETRNRNFFLKFNKASKYPRMFEFELHGLEMLRITNTVNVPEALYTDTTEDYAFLLLSYEEPALPIPGYWRKFAEQLSLLHKVTDSQFGLDHDNYIGSLPQDNTRLTDLYDFLVQYRFEPLVKRAYEQGLFQKDDLFKFDILYKRLRNMIPDEKPALIHGDLWNGNLITDTNGKPMVIDPAVYFGHRELDIGMTRLFGGFPAEFYQLYNTFYPLESGWEERIALNQLYPLLVHVNLFGGTYTYDVRRVLKQYI